jgi:flagellar biosynthesis GTPase FlhF
LARLGNEKGVQKWTAYHLRLTQGRSYSVEREVHVADEKEPDVRFRAKATDASVPLEVKVAETWTLPQLEAALTTQLCDQYLRAREGRHGILLLVHQKPRPRGWTLKRKRLTFDAVVARLRTMVAKIAGSASDAPQPEVAALDVSSFPQKKAAKKKAAKKKAAKKKAAKKKAAKKKAAKKKAAKKKAAKKKAAKKKAAKKKAAKKKAAKKRSAKRKPAIRRKRAT